MCVNYMLSVGSPVVAYIAWPLMFCSLQDPRIKTFAKKVELFLVLAQKELGQTYTV